MAAGQWRVQLLQKGSPTGDIKEADAPETLSAVDFGDSTDQWGLALDPEDVNGPDPIVRIMLNAGGEYNTNIDAVEITFFTQLAEQPLGPASKRVAVVKRADLVEVAPGQFQVKAGAKITFSEVE